VVDWGNSILSFKQKKQIYLHYLPLNYEKAFYIWTSRWWQIKLFDCLSATESGRSATKIAIFVIYKDATGYFILSRAVFYFLGGIFV